MSYPWNIPVPSNASIPAWREAVNDALQYLQGAVETDFVEKTATGALTVDERFVKCPSGTFSLTLPAAADLESRPWVVKNAGSGVITLLPNGFDTIDGEPGYLLSGVGRGVVLYPDATNWIVAAEAGQLQVPSNALVYELDNSLFDGVETFFEGLIPVEPDLSDGRTVFLDLEGFGSLRRRTEVGAPGVREFKLGGATNQDVTFGSAPEAGSIAQAVLAGRSNSSAPRYLYLSGSVGELTAGATPWLWTIADGISGTIEVNCEGARASSGADATGGDAIVQLAHNGVVFGTVTYPSGGGTPVFAAAAPVSVVSGSKIMPILPSPANATLALISITLRVTLDG